MELHTILNKAADLIEYHGLAKQTFFGTSGEFDIIGAIYTVTEGEPGRTELRKAAFCVVYDYVRDDIPKLTLSDWADAPERTATEVVTTLREASRLIHS